ncbi:MAG: prepilin-type N-terminal cleavage/methylation domain-containing protein [Desulfitobacteriaceae bacterium]
MGKWKLSNNYGYTLMELIIALAMIATISTVALPNYTKYIESTREKMCINSRQTIIYEYHLYCITEPEITLSDYISIYYPGYEAHLCTSNGTYTASGSGEMATLTCTMHQDLLTEHGLESANPSKKFFDIQSFCMIY